MITVSLSIIQITHMKNYFVTGTDTGVGKTYFISKFTQQFMNSISINIVKPIESGCELKNGNLVAYDTGIYSKMISKDISKICKYPLQGQFSPHRALKEINKEVTCDELKFFTESQYINNGINFVEGCGGFKSPIATMCLNSDLAKKLDIPIILVIKNKLGCINHTLLTIEMIESLKLNLKLIIFNRFNKEDDSHFEELNDFVKNYDIYNWQGHDFHPEILKKL